MNITNCISPHSCDLSNLPPQLQTEVTRLRISGHREAGESRVKPSGSGIGLSSIKSVIDWSSDLGLVAAVRPKTIAQHDQAVPQGFSSQRRRIIHNPVGAFKILLRCHIFSRLCPGLKIIASLPTLHKRFIINHLNSAALQQFFSGSSVWSIVPRGHLLQRRLVINLFFTIFQLPGIRTWLTVE